MITKYGTGIDLDDISDEFDGEGHRSRSSSQKGLSEQILNPGVCCDVI